MRIIDKILSELKNLQLLLISLFSKVKNIVNNDIPYIGQFASNDYAEKVLKNNTPVKSDPDWQNTGAKSIDEYVEWAPVICGMACVSMILLFLKNKNPGTITLARDAFRHNVYTRENKSFSNMYYKKFITWVEKYNIKATIYSSLNISGIQKLLSDGRLVIASVNPNIRGFQTASPTKRGGHLVLVTGYNKKNGTITINNPSGFSSSHTQYHHTMPISVFLKYYANRGISIENT